MAVRLLRLALCERSDPFASDPGLDTPVYKAGQRPRPPLAVAFCRTHGPYMGKDVT